MICQAVSGAGGLDATDDQRVDVPDRVVTELGGVESVLDPDREPVADDLKRVQLAHHAEVGRIASA